MLLADLILLVACDFLRSLVPFRCGTARRRVLAELAGSKPAVEFLHFKEDG
jgi:hypothetical protein